MPRQRVHVVLKELRDKGLIVTHGNDKRRVSYEIQKNSNEWRIPSMTRNRRTAKAVTHEGDELRTTRSDKQRPEMSPDAVTSSLKENLLKEREKESAIPPDPQNGDGRIARIEDRKRQLREQADTLLRVTDATVD